MRFNKSRMHSNAVKKEMQLKNCMSYLSFTVIFFKDNSTSINANWTGSMRICKMNDTYLLGNINLSNVTSACLRHEHGAPYWIGIFREKYFNTDKGNEFKVMRMKKTKFLYSFF